MVAKMFQSSKFDKNTAQIGRFNMHTRLSKYIYLGIQIDAHSLLQLYDLYYE